MRENTPLVRADRPRTCVTSSPSYHVTDDVLAESRDERDDDRSTSPASVSPAADDSSPVRDLPLFTSGRRLDAFCKSCEFGVASAA